MLIFIENTPRAYAWGSRDALPELLGVKPNGEPQAELWLGDHPSAPASVAKASPTNQTLIELIESDPDLYGVDGNPLPFLLKVLAIGAPLSLQVHPDKAQAEQGFAREEALGVPLDARERNYGDPNHKPELLVALSEVSALCGFRPLADARAELLALAAAAAPGAGRDALHQAAEMCESSEEVEAAAARRAVMNWALGDEQVVAQAVRAIESVVHGGGASGVDGADEGATLVTVPGVDPTRVQALAGLTATYPADAGVLLSLLLHLVTLQPGEAVFLGARQLHAYLGGIGVEVMAASDNVLRAGLTEKHVDRAEVMRIVNTDTLENPRFDTRLVQQGLMAYEPEVPDFRLYWARLRPPYEDIALDSEEDARRGQNPTGFGGAAAGGYADALQIAADYPLVLIVTSGRVRVARLNDEFNEVASVGRGQSLYVSAGEPIELTGCGDAFLATVGEAHPRVS